MAPGIVAAKRLTADYICCERIYEPVQDLLNDGLRDYFLSR